MSDEQSSDDSEQPTDSYRSEDYDQLPKPAVRPTGEAGPSETVSHRSYDHDQLEGAVVASTFRDGVVTKPVTADDAKVGTK